MFTLISLYQNNHQKLSKHACKIAVGSGFLSLIALILICEFPSHSLSDYTMMGLGALFALFAVDLIYYTHIHMHKKKSADSLPDRFLLSRKYGFVQANALLKKRYPE